MQKFSDTVATSVNGQLVILSAATVNVYLAGTTTPASIYSTNAGAAKSNPFQSSATGLIEFYAEDGRYDLVVSKAGYTSVTVSDLLLEDPNDATNDDIAGVAITGSTVDSSVIGEVSPTTGKFTGVRLDSVAPAAAQIGQLRWNDTDGTPEVLLKGGLVTLQMGQEQLVRIYNNTGSPMTDMQVVRVTGSQGQRLTAALAQGNSEVNSSTTFAVVTEPIGNNAEGFATTSGLVRDVNTASFAEGASLWLSPTVAGGVTATKPVAPDHSVLIGWCVRSHATLGSVFVHVQNGHELDELHDVKITSIGDKHFLQYNAGLSVWENSEAIRIGTPSPSLSVNSTMAFNLVSDTQLRVSVRGSDGVTRSTTLTLA